MLRLISWKKPVVVVLTAMLLLTNKAHLAQAACWLTVVNQTGYDLKPLKLVREKGETKKVVMQVPLLLNDRSCTFQLDRGGDYRVYGLLTKNGGEIYAKGNLYSLRNGASYELILKQVKFSDEGSSIIFISKEEFDKLK